jgi:hypothetical protein
MSSFDRLVWILVLGESLPSWMTMVLLGPETGIENVLVLPFGSVAVAVR